MEETGDLKVPQEEGIITKDSLHGELGDIVVKFQDVKMIRK